MARVYTLKQLEHLRNVRALGLDDGFLDDVHTCDKDNFEVETDLFFNWLHKMEKLNKIDELLTTMK